MTVSSAADLRVVIVDARADRRQLMGYVVEISGPNLTVVGYADNALHALAVIDQERAGAAVVEIQMPVAEGLEMIALLRHDHPELRIVVCSFHHEEATRAAAFEGGADAYLTKPVSPRDLYAALRTPASPPAGSPEGNDARQPVPAAVAGPSA